MLPWHAIALGDGGSLFLKETAMSKVQSIKIEDIVIDSSIYPRINIDHKRVSMFE